MGNLYLTLLGQLEVRHADQMLLFYVNPTLPRWLPEIELRQLRIGPCLLTLHFWREGDRSRWEVRESTADHSVQKAEMIQIMDDPGRKV